jgi:hypothetical protein
VSEFELLNIVHNRARNVIVDNCPRSEIFQIVPDIELLKIVPDIVLFIIMPKKESTIVPKIGLLVILIVVSEICANRA